MHRLEDGFFVSGQIATDEMPEIAARGIRMIINNRPDGEVPGQPPAAAIEAAAEAAGIDYRFIPVKQLDPRAVEATGLALQEAQGSVLAFCAVGTRSTYLWALARSAQGAVADDLSRSALAAGVDLEPIRRFLR